MNNPQNVPPESRKTIAPTNNLDEKINEEDKMEQTYPCRWTLIREIKCRALLAHIGKNLKVRLRVSFLVVFCYIFF